MNSAVVIKMILVCKLILQRKAVQQLAVVASQKKLLALVDGEFCCVCVCVCVCVCITSHSCYVE